jgi:hypothetical protein
MNFSLADKIKSILTGTPVEEVAEERKAKANPFPNGPVTYKTVTAGQIRRAEQRARAKQRSQAFRAQRKAYIDREAELAVLRSMLQAIGVLPYVTPEYLVTEERKASATKWLEAKYGEIHTAVLRYEAITGTKVEA